MRCVAAAMKGVMAQGLRSSATVGILIGDILTTRYAGQHGPLQLPTGDSSKAIPEYFGLELGLCRKLTFINEQLALAWAELLRQLKAQR